MPDFKTHLNALLESFGLDYENFVNIPLNYQAEQQLSTSFTPTCDGFLILHVGCRTFGAFIADTVWGNKNVADVHNYNADGFATVNAIVHKGRTYTLNVVQIQLEVLVDCLFPSRTHAKSLKPSAPSGAFFIRARVNVFHFDNARMEIKSFSVSEVFQHPDFKIKKNFDNFLKLNHL